jgi:two-component system sensor histidine kinase RegB
MLAAPTEERSYGNALWLIKLRWVAVLGQLLTILVVRWGMAVKVPLTPLAVLLAVTVFSNVWLIRRLYGGRTGVATLGNVMLLDLANLTGMLYFTGGPGNPFSAFYFVNLGLPAMLLPSRWAWLLNGLAVLGVAVLIWDHVAVAELQRFERLESVRAAGRVTLAHRGIFVAFATCASVVVCFTARLSSELRQREHELLRAEQVRARSEKLEALGTLAAGAAHELATPLSTIAVVAREVERELEGGNLPAAVLEDIGVIRSELDRCRAILDRMAADAGQAGGEPVSPATAEEVLDAVVGPLDRNGRVRVACSQAASGKVVCVPVQGLTQALRGIVKNALDASQGDLLVRVAADCSATHLMITVQDDGEGMSSEVLRRAGEPFFTTKEPGQGMGLGLFLARSIVERLGGNLEIRSAPGQGTTVTVALPLADIRGDQQGPVRP